MGDKGQQRRFYVGGRWYSPDSATPLCRYTDIFERVTLYQTPKGTFFTFRESTVDGLGIDGAELAEFMPSMSKKERADRLIQEDRAAVARLQLSDTEKELLVL